MSVMPRRRRFTVDEYYAMADAGILTEDDRVELIEGEIIQMASIGSRHAACVNRLTRLLVDGAGDAAVVTVQNPVRLSDLTEPQPDFALVQPRPDFYADAHPRPEDVLLIVEVALTTLGYDRDIKLPLYARARVPEVWIVDLEGDAVEVYREASEGEFHDATRAGRNDVLHPVAFPAITVPVAQILT